MLDKTIRDGYEVLQMVRILFLLRPLFNRKWTSDFVLKDDLFRVMPLWVTFPRLPLHLWGRNSLSKIASGIGNPITTNECTAKKLRVSYAKVLIEVDVT